MKGVGPTYRRTIKWSAVFFMIPSSGFAWGGLSDAVSRPEHHIPVVRQEATAHDPGARALPGLGLSLLERREIHVFAKWPRPSQHPVRDVIREPIHRRSRSSRHMPIRPRPGAGLRETPNLRPAV